MRRAFPHQSFFFGEEVVEIGDEGEFVLGACAPSEVELGHEVAEVLAVEDHEVEDGVQEGLQGV